MADESPTQAATTPDALPKRPGLAHRAHLAIQAAGLAVVLTLWTSTFLRSGASGDLWLVLLILPPWVLSSTLIRKGMSAFRWTESLGRALGFCVDSYFLVTAMGLASGEPFLVARVFFVFLFLVAVVGNPGAILMSVATGGLAYFAVLFGDSSSVGLKEVVVWGLIGGVCGMAWKLVIPLLWKAVNLLVSEPKPAAAKPAEPSEADPFAAAGFGKPADAPAAPPPAPALPFTQPGGGEATSAGLPFLTGGPVTLAPGEASADPEGLRQALRTAQQEKDALAKEAADLRAKLEAVPPPAAPAEGGADARVAALEAELAKARADLVAAEKEMAKLYGLDTPPPSDQAPAAAPDGGGAGGSGEELADLRRKLEDALRERDKLAKELEKTNDELMKVYGNT